MRDCFRSPQVATMIEAAAGIRIHWLGGDEFRREPLSKLQYVHDRCADQRMRLAEIAVSGDQGIGAPRVQTVAAGPAVAGARQPRRGLLSSR